MLHSSCGGFFDYGGYSRAPVLGYNNSVGTRSPAVLIIAPNCEVRYLITDDYEGFFSFSSAAARISSTVAYS